MCLICQSKDCSGSEKVIKVFWVFFNRIYNGMTHVVYMLHTHRLSLIHRPLARPLFIKMYRFCIRLKSTYKPFQETYLHMWHSGPFVNNEAKKCEFTSQNARGVTRSCQNAPSSTKREDTISLNTCQNKCIARINALPEQGGIKNTKTNLCENFS